MHTKPPDLPRSLAKAMIHENDIDGNDGDSLIQNTRVFPPNQPPTESYRSDSGSTVNEGIATPYYNYLFLTTLPTPTVAFHPIFTPFSPPLS